MQNIWKYVTIAVMLALVLGACSPSPTGHVTAAQETIKIGVLTPLTGGYGFLGENVVMSAKLAVEELGLEDRVELIIEDAGNVGEGKKAISAYRKLVDVHGVEFIIDAMSSDGTMAVAPLVDIDRVVMMTPFTGGENIDNAAEYLFRNGPSDVMAGTQPAEDMFEKFGIRRVAMFTDNAEYTLDISKHFRKTFSGDVVVDEIVMPDKSDYRTEIAKVMNEEIDGVFIATTSGKSSNMLIKQLYEAGNDAPIFANFLAWNSDTVEVAGDGAEDVFIYDPEFAEEQQMVKELFESYENRYGEFPRIPFHTTGVYDNVVMAVEAVDSVGEDGPAMRAYLLSHIRNWKGMNGVVTFDEKGNSQTGFILKQIRDGQLVTI